MKLLLFNLFLITLLSTISVVFGQMQDCVSLNTFLNRKLDTACCGIIKKDCDVNNFIQKLEL